MMDKIGHVYKSGNYILRVLSKGLDGTYEAEFIAVPDYLTDYKVGDIFRDTFMGSSWKRQAHLESEEGVKNAKCRKLVKHMKRVEERHLKNATKK